MANEKATYTIDLNDKFSRGFSKIDRRVETFEDRVNRLKGKKGGGGSGLGGLSMIGGLKAGAIASIGYAALEAGKTIVKLGAELEQTRISFATMFGTVERGNEVVRRLNEFSNVTPFDNRKVLASGRTLAAFGFEAEELVPTLTLIGDVSAGTGKDLQEMAVIFGQIKGAGRLMGQDLLQLINAGFNPLQIISEKTGKSMSTLKDEMSKGLITFEDVKGAFQDATSEGGLFFNLMEKQSRSFNGRMSTLSGKLGLYFAQLGEKGLPVFGKIVDGLIDIVDLLPKLDFSPFIDNVRALGDSFNPIIDMVNDFLELFGFEGLSKLDKFQYALDTLALTMRIGFYPLRLLAEGVSALGNVARETGEIFNGLGILIKGALTQNLGLIYQGATKLGGTAQNVGSKILADLKDAYKQEEAFYSKLYTQREQKKEEGISLGGAASAGGSTANAVTSAGRDKVGSSIRGSSPKNITLNVNKLIEQVVFEKYADGTENDLMDRIKRALLTSLNDVVIANN